MPDPKAASVLGENIFDSKNVKLLGLTFSYDLNWYTYIEKIPTPAKKILVPLKYLDNR